MPTQPNDPRTGNPQLTQTPSLPTTPSTPQPAPSGGGATSPPTLNTASSAAPTGPAPTGYKWVQKNGTWTLEKLAGSSGGIELGSGVPGTGTPPTQTDYQAGITGPGGVGGTAVPGDVSDPTGPTSAPGAPPPTQATPPAAPTPTDSFQQTPPVDWQQIGEQWTQGAQAPMAEFEAGTGQNVGEFQDVVDTTLDELDTGMGGLATTVGLGAANIASGAESRGEAATGTFEGLVSSIIDPETGTMVQGGQEIVDQLTSTVSDIAGQLGVSADQIVQDLDMDTGALVAKYGEAVALTIETLRSDIQNVQDQLTERAETARGRASETYGEAYDVYGTGGEAALGELQQGKSAALQAVDQEIARLQRQAGTSGALTGSAYGGGAAAQSLQASLEGTGMRQGVIGDYAKQLADLREKIASGQAGILGEKAGTISGIDTSEMGLGADVGTAGATTGADIGATAAGTTAGIEADAAQTGAGIKAGAAETGAGMRAGAAETGADIAGQTNLRAGELGVGAAETALGAKENLNTLISDIKTKGLEMYSGIKADALVQTSLARVEAAGIVLTEQQRAKYKKLETELTGLDRKYEAAVKAGDHQEMRRLEELRGNIEQELLIVDAEATAKAEGKGD